MRASFSDGSGSAVGGYVLAVLLSAAFVGLRLGLEPWLHRQAPLIVLLAAPILSSWLGGFGPGVLATLLCAIAGEVLFVGQFPDTPGEQLRLAVFLTYGVLFSWLIQSRSSALRDMRIEHEQLVKAREQLAQRERRMRETLEASPSGMLLVDPQGRIELVNRQAERLFGYSRDELVGMSVDALVPDSVRPRHAGLRRGYHAQPAHVSLGPERQLFARRKDGTQFPVQIGLNPLEGESEGLVLASVLDVSGQHQAEAALRRSQGRLQRLFETNLMGIVFWDQDGRVLEANDEVLRIWGRDRESLAREGLSLADITPPEYAGHDARSMEELRATGRMQPAEKTYVRADGSRVWVLVGSAMTAENVGVSFVLDISARKQAELALQEHAAMFRSLADNIAQLAWMTDATGYVTWYNRRWFEYTGGTFEQMQGWGWQSVHHPDHAARVVDKFRRHMASGEPWEDTFPLRGHDGQYRWFLSRAFPLRDHAGRIHAWFGTNTDITAQRQAEQALREADRRKDEFIAMLAHELRNPLAPVRHSVEILKRIDLHEPRLERVRDIIGRQVTHMARLIDDLLDVGRIARGKLTLRKELCELSALVAQTAEDYRASLEAADQQLVVHRSPAPAWVEGDTVRLAQMLGNLLVNAARFTEGPGTVEVRTVVDVERHQVRVSVRDTGMGMDQDMLGRLFDPFAQASQDMARSKGGLGLGLALTKGLAELHGGGVMAESEGPGRGSTFTLVLPLARHARPERPPPAKGEDGTPLRILVIEDNADSAATLGELLQLGGHHVELAHDGQSGIEKARRLLPDVVISDIGLPGKVSGYEVGRTLRDEPSLEGVYLVALSGYADANARRRCAEAGFDAHLAKPPDVGALERVLGAVRGRRPRALADER